jgi:hypothetical protein
LRSGTSLPDPDSLLVGTSARMRHVKLRTPRDAARQAVVDLIHEAVVARR